MLKQTLSLKLKNKLALTLSLKQQLSLLLLPKLELKELLKQELDENPFLEEVINSEPITDNLKDLSKNFGEDNDEKLSPLNKLKYKPSLYEILETQVNLEFDKKDRPIVEEIINNIDEKGFFKGKIDKISQKFKVSYEYIEYLRKRLMTLEPTGIGAISVEEALWEQYKEIFGNDKLVKDIILNSFKSLTNKNYILKKYKISEEFYKNLVEDLKTLSPYPTYSFSNEEETIFIEPDIFVYDKGDKFEIEINERDLPKLRLTSQYKRLIKNEKLSEDVKKFIEDRLQRAIGIIKGIELRRENLLKITEFLVNYQSDFLRKGKGYLKPLTLKDVSKHVDLHESTISRIVSNKYIQSDFGILPLKAFFSTKLNTNQGDISVERVKHLLMKIVENEDKAKPLSDEKIAKILNQNYGIKIARRTVAKYREELNIPASKERRKKE